MKFNSFARILGLILSLAMPVSQCMHIPSKAELKREVYNLQIPAEDLNLLKAAIDSFYATPGFQETLQFILNDNDESKYKGCLWEIECALNLCERESILAFNQHMPDDSGREFDIITNKHWIECKNIEPKQWRKKKQKFFKQFIEQRNIVTEHNQTNTPIKYTLCSKNEIPVKWKAWFDENNISYCKSFISAPVYPPSEKSIERLRPNHDISTRSRSSHALEEDDDKLLKFLMVAAAAYAAYKVGEAVYDAHKTQKLKTEKAEPNNLKQPSNEPEPTSLSKAAETQTQPAKSRLVLYLICITSIIYWLYYQA